MSLHTPTHSPAYSPLTLLVAVEGPPTTFDAGLAVGLSTDSTRFAPLQPPFLILLVLVARVVVVVEGLARGRGGGGREDMVGVGSVGTTAANKSHHERAEQGVLRTAAVPSCAQ